MFYVSDLSRKTVVVYYAGKHLTPAPHPRPCVKMCTSEHMSETLSIRIDAQTKKRLHALAKRSKRSKSFLAAEEITAYVDAEEWQLEEIQAGITELDAGRQISHERVSKWMRSWGKRAEARPPR